MTDKPTVPQLGIVSPLPTPNDASDIEALWLDPALGDGLTDTNWHTIPVDKPKDFFRVHPDPTIGVVPRSMPTSLRARSIRRITSSAPKCVDG